MKHFHKWVEEAKKKKIAPFEFYLVQERGSTYLVCNDPEFIIEISNQYGDCSNEPSGIINEKF